jgi:host factor-I protein
MTQQSQSIQDVFLNACRKEKQQVTIFLVGGVKLQGVVTGFDNFSLVLKRGPQTQLVYKHAISTIIPTKALEIYHKVDGVVVPDENNKIGVPMINDDGSFQIA